MNGSFLRMQNDVVKSAADKKNYYFLDRHCMFCYVAQLFKSNPIMRPS
jgi:hypothetical protein